MIAGVFEKKLIPRTDAVMDGVMDLDDMDLLITTKHFRRIAPPEGRGAGALSRFPLSP